MEHGNRFNMRAGLFAGNLLAPFCGCLAVGGMQKVNSRFQLPRLRRRRASLLRELRVWHAFLRGKDPLMGTAQVSSADCCHAGCRRTWAS